MKTKIQNLKTKLQNIEEIDELFPELNIFQHELYSAGYTNEGTILYWCLSYECCDVDDVLTALNIIERLIA